MPQKLAKLLTDLAKAGFVCRGGKGSHRNYKHPCGYQLTISAHRGDAKHYQERAITEAIESANLWKKEHENESQ